ncbi:MAG: hypothetical protein ACR65R_02005 [Methylomicrobium sp.]
MKNILALLLLLLLGNAGPAAAGIQAMASEAKVQSDTLQNAVDLEVFVREGLPSLCESQRIPVHPVGRTARNTAIDTRRRPRQPRA